MKAIALSDETIPPVPNISKSGWSDATSEHFFNANGLKRDPKLLR